MAARGWSVLDNRFDFACGRCVGRQQPLDPCSSGVPAMKTRLSSALGFALLAASFIFGSSFVYAEVPEATTSALQTVVPDNEAKVTETPSSSGAQTGVAE